MVTDTHYQVKGLRPLAFELINISFPKLRTDVVYRNWQELR